MEEEIEITCDEWIENQHCDKPAVVKQAKSAGNIGDSPYLFFCADHAAQKRATRAAAARRARAERALPDLFPDKAFPYLFPDEESS